MTLTTLLVVALIFAVIVALILWGVSSAPPELLSPRGKTWARFVVIGIAVILAVIFLAQFLPVALSPSNVVVPVRSR